LSSLQGPPHGGTVRLFSGETWIDAVKGDFLYVPHGEIRRAGDSMAGNLATVDVHDLAGDEG
jgi:hypothetical protein